MCWREEVYSATLVHIYQVTRHHIPEWRYLHCIISSRNSFLEAFPIIQPTRHRASEILVVRHWEQFHRKMSWYIWTYVPNNLPWETEENHRWIDITITGFLTEITSSEASWIWSKITTETIRKGRDVGVTELWGCDDGKRLSATNCFFALCPSSGGSKLGWKFYGSVQYQVSI